MACLAPSDAYAIAQLVVRHMTSTGACVIDLLAAGPALGICSSIEIRYRQQAEEDDVIERLPDDAIWVAPTGGGTLADPRPPSPATTQWWVDDGWPGSPPDDGDDADADAADAGAGGDGRPPPSPSAMSSCSTDVPIPSPTSRFPAKERPSAPPPSPASSAGSASSPPPSISRPLATPAGEDGEQAGPGPPDGDGNKNSSRPPTSTAFLTPPPPPPTPSSRVSEPVRAPSSSPLPPPPPQPTRTLSSPQGGPPDQPLAGPGPIPTPDRPQGLPPEPIHINPPPPPPPAPVDAAPTTDPLCDAPYTDIDVSEMVADAAHGQYINAGGLVVAQGHGGEGKGKLVRRYRVRCGVALPEPPAPPPFPGFVEGAARTLARGGHRGCLEACEREAVAARALGECMGVAFRARLPTGADDDGGGGGGGGGGECRFWRGKRHRFLPVDSLPGGDGRWQVIYV
ncbi:hypothetical protein F4802DRAFT_617281 [Xylaria palmicola]|nr:hypothetical protein F4802DRAFT_617281 [Xylaria palmicola]